MVAKELERANMTEGNQSDELNTDDENEEEEVCLCHHVMSCDLVICTHCSMKHGRCVN